MNGKSRLALGAAAVVLLATVASAAVSLPGRVDVYYAPTDRPDAVLELWQYLALVVVVSAVMALVLVALGSMLLALAIAFLPGSTAAGTSVGTWVAAWTLLWCSGAVWLAVWLGNEEPTTRSWLELLLVLAGLAGTCLIAGWHAWRAARRAEPRPQRARASR